MSTFPSKATIAKISDCFTVQLARKATATNRIDQFLDSLKSLLHPDLETQTSAAIDAAVTSLIQRGHPLVGAAEPLTRHGHRYRYAPTEPAQASGFLEVNTPLFVLVSHEPHRLPSGRSFDSPDLAHDPGLDWSVLRHHLPESRDANGRASAIEQLLQDFVESAVCLRLEHSMRQLAHAIGVHGGHKLVRLAPIDDRVHEINWWDSSSGLLVGVSVIAAAELPLSVDRRLRNRNRV